MTTTKEQQEIMFDSYDRKLTVDEVETFRLLETLVGQTVVRICQDGRTMIGTLESVYLSDGIAANVIGLVDWSKNGKDYGRDFSIGPLYGDRIIECPDPWIGHKAGNAVKVFPNRWTADAALDVPFERRTLDGVSPYHQPGR